MQRLYYGSLFTISFSDTTDLSSTERDISNLMSAGSDEHGWLVLNHPEQAGTQVKLSVTRGVPIIIVRQEGVPVTHGDGTAGNWVFTGE
jgi:hypothetical protein